MTILDGLEMYLSRISEIGQREVPPTVIIGNGKKIGYLDFKFENVDDKNELAVYLRKLALNKVMKEFLFTAESWMAINKDEEMHLPVRHRENKVDILMVFYSSPNRSIMHFAKVHETPSGRVLGEWEKNEEKLGSGLFGGVWKDVLALTN